MEDVIKEVRQYAAVKLSPEMFDLLLQDNPAHHAPLWHMYGVLGHAAATVLAVQRLQEATGCDPMLVKIATFHDIGKIRKFPNAIALFAQGLDPAPAYRNHESTSVVITRGITPIDFWSLEIMRAHGMAYQSKSTTIIRRLEQHSDRLRLWMLLCAADAVGKGWTPAQVEQRPQVAEKFRAIARLMEIPDTDITLLIACEAVEEWALPQLPKFIEAA